MKNLSTRMARIVALVPALMILSLTSFAGARNWIGGTSTAWGTAANWSGGVVPHTGDDVTISGGAFIPNLSTGTYTIHSLTVSSSVTISGGTIYIIGGGITISGTYNQSGGTLFTDHNIMVKPNSTMNMSGGVLWCGASFASSIVGSIQTWPNCTVNQSGGTIHSLDFASIKGTYNQTGASALLMIKRNWHPNNQSVFNATAGTVEFTGSATDGDFSIGSNQFCNVTVDDACDPQFSKHSGSWLGIYGNFDNKNNALSVTTGATFYFNGTGAQIISSLAASTATFGHLTVKKPTGTLTFTTTALVAGNFYLLSGTVDIGTYLCNRLTSGGTISLSAGTLFKLAGTTGGKTGSNFPTNYTTLYIDATNTVEYYGSGQQVFTNTYGHLTISAAGTKTCVASNTIRGNFTLSTATFVGGAFTHFVGGNWTMTSGTFTNTGTGVTFNGTINQTVTSTGAFNVMTINKTAGYCYLGSHVTATTLTFIKGTVTTNAWYMVIPSGGSVTGASQSTGWIDGNESLWFQTTAGAQWEVGSTYYYSPCAANFTGINAPGYIVCKVTDASHPNIGSSTMGQKNVSRYWTLFFPTFGTPLDYNNMKLTLIWQTIDNYSGLSTLNLKMAQYYGGTWSYPAIQNSSTITTCNSKNISTLGDFTGGEPTACTTTSGFTYASADYCTNGGIATAIMNTGATAGTFTASPSTGLTLTSTNGNFNPATSTPGTYTITNTVSGACPTSSAKTIKVSQAPSASISYSGTSFCQTGGFANATITGTTGGVFTSTAGIDVNYSTGQITLGNSDPGTYTITYTLPTANSCGTFTTTATVTVTPANYALIAYSDAAYCLNGGAALIDFEGTTGGTFSSTSGLVINSSTGTVTLGSCTPGSYTVTYSGAATGGCSAFTATAPLTITASAPGSISYAGQPYCTDGTSASATVTGTTGGTFSAAPAGLVIDDQTGDIDIANSDAGVYTVRYDYGSCYTTTTVTVNQAPDAGTISYTSAQFCKNYTTAQPCTLTGNTGGVYTASPAGLSINSSTGAITPSASTAGTYTITYTIAAANGCTVKTATTTMTIIAAASATISYAGTPFCTSVSGAQPITFSGTAGGSYTASPAGLTLNASTGAVTPSTSTPGTYTVTYSINGCNPFFTTTSVTITQMPAATISYAGTPYCTSISTAQSVTRTGTAGGTYTASPAGLTIDATTGAITPSTSTAGTYTVSYTIAAAGGCAQVTATASVAITTMPAATITYAGTPFCTSLSTAQSVTVSGTSGGTFSSTAGLTLDATTGAIIPSTSTAGTYTVTYAFAAAGGCAAFSTTTSVTITQLPVASISYAGTPFCKTLATGQSVTQTGNSGGTYTASPAGLSINSSTGAITPSTSTAGTYTVTYTIAAAGGCSAVTATASVTITAIPSATISYAGTPFCKSVATAQSVTQTGSTGGTYSASPAGLTIDATTGAITPSSSTAGTYTVTYTIAAAGGCSAYNFTTSVTITAIPSATISYAGTPFCTSVATAQAVTQSGSSGGTYSASPAGLTINSSTGAITPSTSTPGTYTVTYTIAAANGCSAYNFTTSVTITQMPSATISYAGTPFCKSVATAQSVTQTGTSGGTYSSTAGLTINSSTGAITPSTSTAGTYTVTYTVAAAGGCAAIAPTTSVTITAIPSATISYSGTPFCTSVATAQSVTQSGSSGGTYSASPAGLTINSATGAITPSTSTPGTYTVTYTIAAANGCSAYNFTTSVAITQMPSATISYSGTPFCKSVATAQSVTQTGTSGGTYSSTAGLTINSSTGAITPSTSTAGTYTVTYTVAAAGGCAAIAPTTSVTITAIPSATISYSGTPFCTSVATAQSVTQTGSSGGTYSASPAGLTINSATGAITPSTSTPGTYTVTYTIAAANGCSAYNFTTSVTITQMPSATISYSGTPFCKSVSTAQTVTQSGTTGGTYSASPAGLTINSSTGDITPSSSTAGTYTVTYTVAAAGGCAVYTTTTSVTITAIPSATISYAGTPFCKSVATAQSVTQSGSSGGTYSASPVGLTINSSTGAITPSTSTVGTYTVTYTIAAAGGCSAYNFTTSVTITAIPSATISYSGTPFCTSVATAQSVTQTGSAGGTYSASPAGLTINSSTGDITPSTSTAGTYTVTYTIAAAGGCSAYNFTTSVTITQMPSATISYSGTPFCKSVSTAQAVTQTGTSGGTYSSTAGLAINSANGAITPSASTVGTYTVTYTIAAAGNCSAIAPTTSVTITAIPSATISYAGTPFCTSVSTAQSVTQTGSSGGTYSASPAGLTINSSTGAITPSTSTPGTYTVTYTIAAAGGCSAYNFTTSVTITAMPSATISYSGTPFCKTVATAQAVTLTGTGGGTYSASPAGLTINSSTGAITPSTSTAGTYTVTYSIAAASGCAAFSTTTSVTITALATISYVGSPFCQSTSTAQSVTQTGATGGTYSSTAGLSIDATTGAITPSGSTAGTYTVTYSVGASGGCAAHSATTSVTVTNSLSGSISYAGTPFCKSVSTAQPVTQTGTSGGTYSSTVGLTIDATTGAITPSTSTAGTYTVTYTVPASGPCAGFSTTASVTITTAPSATISYGAAPFCPSGSVSVSQSGTAGGTYSSTAGLSINAFSGTIALNLSAPGSYTVTYTVPASGGCAAYPTTAGLSIITPGTWTGATSTDWNTNTNWECNILPTATTNVLIPSGLTNYPLVSGITPEVRNLTIQLGATVTISNGTLKTNGTISATGGNIIATNGGFELTGTSAQTIPANLFSENTIKNLTIDNAAGVTLAGTLRLTGWLGFGSVSNSVFATGGHLTLGSTATATANVGNISNGNSISGDVVVERYIPAKRSFRFLTAPVNSSASIKNNWMEGVNNTNTSTWLDPYPGYGTHITGPGSSTNGFDATNTNNPSMFTYNNSTGTWSTIPNTWGVLTAGTPYRILVRGSRAVDLSNNAAAPSITTLRATGTLQQGTVTLAKPGGGGTTGMPTLSATTGGYSFVANPYASVVDWHMLEKSYLSSTIYVWDPTVTGSNGRGAYVAYNDLLGSNNNATSVLDNYIQSGQAFFVQTTGPNPALIFKEQYKALPFRAVYRGANAIANMSVQVLLPQQILGGGAADGVKAFYDSAFADSVGIEDSYHFNNLDENLGIVSQGQVLSLEGRSPVRATDTLQLKMWQMTQPAYAFKISMFNFGPGVQAFLEDTYTHTSTPITSDDTTLVPFAITSDTASANKTRFRIVYKQASTLPVQMLAVHGYAKDKGVQVEWSALSEVNMKEYELQRSANGREFTAISSAPAKNIAVAGYQYFDANPYDGINYYRVKSIGKDGTEQLSNVVKVKLNDTKPGISIYPNPLHGTTFNVVLNNVEKGSYRLALYNNAGQEVFATSLALPGGNYVQQVTLLKALIAGIYQLRISNEKASYTTTVIMEATFASIEKKEKNKAKKESKKQ